LEFRRVLFRSRRLGRRKSREKDMLEELATFDDAVSVGVGIAQWIIDTGVEQIEEVDALAKQFSDAISGHTNIVAWCALGGVTAQLMHNFVKNNNNNGIVNKQVAQIIMSALISRFMSAQEALEEGQKPEAK